MARRPYSGSPHIIASTLMAPALRLPTIARITQKCGADGIDLDLRARRIPTPKHLADVVNDHQIGVVSIWVPRRGSITRLRASQDHQRLALLAESTKARTMIVALPMLPSGKISRSIIAKVTEPLRAYVPSQCRIAIALNRGHLQAGHANLVQLTMLRRLAEEWDVDIVLDLSRSVDPGWEAEAGILRLGNRLTLVRVAARFTNPVITSRERLSRRVIAAALDNIAPPIIALSPALLPWQRFSSRACTEAIALSADYIHERYRTAHEARASSVIPDIRPSTRA